MSPRKATPKPRHGGARKGAGRKPAPAAERATERVSLFLTTREAGQLDELCKLYELDRASVIRIALESVAEAERECDVCEGRGFIHIDCDHCDGTGVCPGTRHTVTVTEHQE